MGCCVVGWARCGEVSNILDPKVPHQAAPHTHTLCACDYATTRRHTHTHTHAPIHTHTHTKHCGCVVMLPHACMCMRVAVVAAVVVVAAACRVAAVEAPLQAPAPPSWPNSYISWTYNDADGASAQQPAGEAVLRAAWWGRRGGVLFWGAATQCAACLVCRPAIAARRGRHGVGDGCVAVFTTTHCVVCNEVLAWPVRVPLPVLVALALSRCW